MSEHEAVRPPRTVPNVDGSQHADPASAVEGSYGLVPCAACGTTVDPASLYADEEGQICGVCHADREAEDTRQRGDAELAMSTLLAPAWVGLALLVLAPLTLLFSDQPWVWAWLPAIVSAVGLRTAARGAFAEGIGRRNRVQLVTAGLLTTAILLSLAVALGASAF